MTAQTNIPTMYRCANCGAWWTGSHTCPTVPTPTAQPFIYQAQPTLVGILEELKAIRALLERKP